jgi:hypothetical protein
MDSFSPHSIPCAMHTLFGSWRRHESRTINSPKLAEKVAEL